jgi:hypothetical protein
MTNSRHFLRGLKLAVAASLLPAAARALPPSDPVSIWTFQDESASISTAAVTDRFYTNGLKLGWFSGTESVPAPLVTMGQRLWGDGRQRIGFEITQQIYTPFNTSTSSSVKGDRPYAGVLMGTISLLSDTDTSRSVMSLGLGVTGPLAQGQEMQDFVHSVIGQRKDAGWGSQLPNEPATQITSSRVWRLKTGEVMGLDTEALPDLTAAIGTLRVYAESGVTFRIGQGLEADFGAPRLRPGQTGSDVFTRPTDVGWYAFAGGLGRAVAYDTTLNGAMFQSSARVRVTPVVGEFQAGFAIMAYGTRLTYTQVIQTQEFRHQRGGPHQMGSLALSVRF